MGKKSHEKTTNGEKIHTGAKILWYCIVFLFFFVFYLIFRCMKSKLGYILFITLGKGSLQFIGIVFMAKRKKERAA